MITHGLDVSLNHGAIIQLLNGKMDQMWYWTNLAGAAKRYRYGYHLKLPKTKDKAVLASFRIDFIKELLTNIVVYSRPDFMAIEDYALSKNQGAHHLGEAGGIAKQIYLEHGIKFRTHDPSGLKMFTTWDGNADKDAMKYAVERRWGKNFDRFDHGKNTVTSEDLCDAFALSRLAWIEARIRSGHLTMDRLKHDKERQVFNRVTKAYPVNILGREWIHDPDWKKKMKKATRRTIHYLQAG